MTLSADLLALVDAYGQQCFDESNLSGIAESMRHALLSAIEALEKDAARYRWLRAQARGYRWLRAQARGYRWLRAQARTDQGVPFIARCHLGGFSAWEGDSADAAIDQAMGEG